MPIKKVMFAFLGIMLLGFGTASAESISGTVRNAKWGPGYEKYLSGVTLYARGTPENKATTKSDGSYTLDNVPEGENFIVFSKDGFVTDMKRVEITKSDEVQKVDMALVEKGLTTISDDRFFNEELNLDYPGLENVKKAILQKDYLLAKYELIKYYRERKTPVWNVKPKKVEEIHTNAGYLAVVADQGVAHSFNAQGIVANVDNIGKPGDINWLFTPNGDKEWYWWVNRMFQMIRYGQAWENTLDPKYAYAYMSQYLEWIQDNPKPFWRDSVGAWRTLEAGIRYNYPLENAWNYFLFNEDITTEARITFLKSDVEHAEYLTSYMGGGNWLIFESRGLYTIASLNPEYKKAPIWLANAAGRGYAQLVGQFKPDGWQYEITPNYHNEATNSLVEIEKVANLNGYSTPLKQGLAKAYDVENLLTLPGGRILPANDTAYYDMRSLLRGAASLFTEDGMQGQDYLFTASDFRIGKSNPELSHLFDYAGYVTMRDYWGPMSTFLFFEGGPSGVGSHGFSSRDKLQLVLSAFGRDMLIDPGSIAYTGEPLPASLYKTQSHNTVTVDGIEQVRRAAGMTEPAKDVTLYSGNGFDYTKAKFDETYGETVHLDAQHERKVFFDKDGIIFVSDFITGSGTHSIEQYWNLAPCAWEYEQNSNKVIGKYDDGTGLILLPVSKDKITGDVVAGGMDPIRGWIGSEKNCAEPAPNVCYQIEGAALPAAIHTVLIPYSGEVPKVKAEYIAAQADAEFPESQAEGLVVTMPDGTKRYYFVRNRGEGTITYGNFTFDGETAEVTKDASGKVINIKKYPESSHLQENNHDLFNANVKITSPDGGAVINSDKAVITAEVSPVPGETVTSVRFYAKYNDGSVIQEKMIADVEQSPYTVQWDVSGIVDQNDVQLWAVARDAAGAESYSPVVKGIDIDTVGKAENVIEAEDRSVEKTGETLSVVDDTAANKSAQSLKPGAAVSRKVESQEPIELRVRAKGSESSQIRVTAGEIVKEFILSEAYADYEIGEIAPSDGRILIKVENSGNDALSIDRFALSGAQVTKQNHMVLRHRLCVGDDFTYFGDSKMTDVTLSAKLMIKTIGSPKREGSAGIGTRYSTDGSYRLYYNDRVRKIQLWNYNTAGSTLLAETGFEWDKSKWYHFKLQAEGSALFGKVWQEGSEEPQEWQLKAEDQTYTQGSVAIIADRADLLIDDVRIVSEENNEEKEIYFNDMERLLSAERPGDWTNTKTGNWVAEDIRSIR